MLPSSLALLMFIILSGGLGLLLEAFYGLVLWPAIVVASWLVCRRLFTGPWKQRPPWQRQPDHTAWMRRGNSGDILFGLLAVAVSIPLASIPAAAGNSKLSLSQGAAALGVIACWVLGPSAIIKGIGGKVANRASRPRPG